MPKQLNRSMYSLRWLLCVLALCFTAGIAEASGGEDGSRTVRIDGGGRAELVLGEGGTPVFLVERPGKGVERLSPEAFADRMLAVPSSDAASWAYYTLNISSWGGLAWVFIGFLGQALFTGRMLVQWLSSEKHKRSVVPVAFWWMSLGGATMLLCYFLWRRDVIGVLGQTTGWGIYLRNLWLIYRPRIHEATASRAPGVRETQAAVQR